MEQFIRSFSRKQRPDHLHEISDRVYVFDCCLSQTKMSEIEYESYMDSAVSSLQRHHLGASYMVFNFTKEDETNGQSLLSNILSQHEMMVVDYPLHYESFPLPPLEMIHYFLKSSTSWLSLEGERNVILLHCEEEGWHVLAFMLAGLLLYSKKCRGEQKTLEMLHKEAPLELLRQASPVDLFSSQLRYLGYVGDWLHSDSVLVIDSIVLKNVPLIDGEGCKLAVMVYGQDPFVRSDGLPRLLFSSLSNEESVRYDHEESCLSLNLDIKQHVQGDVFLDCVRLSEDLGTRETIFSVMFHTTFVQSNALILGSDEVDALWDAKSKFPKEFKAEVHFSAIEEAQDDDQEESCYESESEFFEVEEFDNSDSEGIRDDSFDWRMRDLPPNYTIEELGDDSATDIAMWTHSKEIMFSVESFKQLYLGDLDDSDGLEADSEASSVENIVITDETEPAHMAEPCDDSIANSKHVVVLSVRQEQEDEIQQKVSVDSESSEEGSEIEMRHVRVEIEKKAESQVMNQRKNKKKLKLADAIAKVSMQKKVVSAWIPRIRERDQDSKQRTAGSEEI